MFGALGIGTAKESNSTLTFFTSAHRLIGRWVRLRPVSAEPQDSVSRAQFVRKRFDKNGPPFSTKNALGEHPQTCLKPRDSCASVQLETSPNTHNALESKHCVYAAVAGFGSMLPPEDGVPGRTCQLPTVGESGCSKLFEILKTALHS